MTRVTKLSLQNDIATRDTTIADLTAKVENLTQNNENQASAINHWRKLYYDYIDASNKDRAKAHTDHFNELGAVQQRHEAKIAELTQDAGEMIGETILVAREKLSEQAAQANAVILDLKVRGALEIERAKSDTLAYAFEHVTSKLADNANAAALAVRADDASANEAQG